MRTIHRAIYWAGVEQPQICGRCKTESVGLCVIGDGRRIHILPCGCKGKSEDRTNSPPLTEAERALAMLMIEAMGGA